MKRTDGDYDVVIVGGGPAGSAAAWAAREKGLRTLLLERGPRPVPGACAGWLGPAAVRVCSERGVSAKRAGGSEFAGLRLRSWDLEHCVDVHDAELSGWVVDPARLSAALFEIAGEAGAELRCEVELAGLELGENHATLAGSGGQQATGRVALIADGASSPRVARGRPAPVRQSRRVGGCAFAATEIEDAGIGVDLVIAGGRSLKALTIVRNRAQLRAVLLTRDSTTSPADQLDGFLIAAQDAGVIPPIARSRAMAAPDLAGVALELESHVGKRCLLIGDAGGFVASFSNEGIYPAMRSGRLAAETVARAFQAPVLQDELATFSATWRADLAEYLRMPNTDLGLLMPMVFNNPQMSRRVARAFLLGQAF